MKITGELTDVFETIDGVRCRLFDGETDDGVKCLLWVRQIAVDVDAARAAFARELVPGYNPPGPLILRPLDPPPDAGPDGVEPTLTLTDAETSWLVPALNLDLCRCDPRGYPDARSPVLGAELADTLNGLWCKLVGLDHSSYVTWRRLLRPFEPPLDSR